jgi:hypothetical protein
MLRPEAEGVDIGAVRASLPLAVAFFFFEAESAGSTALGDSVGEGGVAAGVAALYVSTSGISGDDVHILDYFTSFIVLFHQCFKMGYNCLDTYVHPYLPIAVC